MPVRSVSAWRQLLRAWQKEAHIAFTQSDERDFMCVVTPGGGKTIFGLYCAHALLDMELVSQVIIVVPSENLKTQWRKKAHEVGLNLMAELTNRHVSDGRGAIGSEFHGCVVTYQQVAAAPGAAERLTKEDRTFAIFDEIHHAGERRSWAGALRQAFGGVPRRLGLSGTLFRSDNAQIPFVHYDEKGVSCAKFPYGYCYGYSAALRDGIVPSIIFPHYEGRVEYLDRSGVIKSLILGDEVSEREAAVRLRMALSMKGEWLPSVLEEGDKRLTEVRQAGHLDAGGLALAMDREHAIAIGDFLRELTHEEPCVVYSEDPEAKDLIERYKRGRGRWIVAIRMVSEGVDIPRLRVGVYATNVVTELFFRQAIGRLLRLAAGQEDQVGAWYLPSVAELLIHAEKFKEERDHVICEDDGDDITRGPTGPREKTRGPQLVSASSGTRVGVIEDGTAFAEWEVCRAEQKCSDIGVPLCHAPALIRAYRAGKIEVPEWKGQQAPGEPQIPTETLEERLARLRSKANAKVHVLVERTGEKHSKINSLLNEATGVTDIRRSSIEQLIARNRLVDEWLSKTER